MISQINKLISSKLFTIIYKGRIFIGFSSPHSLSTGDFHYKECECIKTEKKEDSPYSCLFLVWFVYLFNLIVFSEMK